MAVPVGRSLGALALVRGLALVYDVIPAVMSSRANQASVVSETPVHPSAHGLRTSSPSDGVVVATTALFSSSLCNGFFEPTPPSASISRISSVISSRHGRNSPFHVKHPVCLKEEGRAAVAFQQGAT